MCWGRGRQFLSIRLYCKLMRHFMTNFRLYVWIISCESLADESREISPKAKIIRRTGDWPVCTVKAQPTQADDIFRRFKAFCYA